MKMKGIWFALFALSGFLLHGSEVGLNGDFEKSQYIQGVGRWPDSWHLNRNVTRNAIVELCEDAEAVHSGKYALSMECEKDGRAYIYRHPLVPAENNEILKISVFLKGTGIFTVGFCVFGYEENPKKIVHLTSVSSPRLQTVKGKWTGNEWIFKVQPVTVKGITYRRFMLMPFLNLNGEGLLLIDSYAMEKKLSETAGGH